MVFYFDSECANCQKRAWGSIEFCCLRPEGPIARVGLLGKGSGQIPGRSRFFCTLRSPSTPCSLFCYVIKGKQLQKSFSLAAKGVEPTPPGARNYIRRWGWGFQLLPNPHILPSTRILLTVQFKSRVLFVQSGLQAHQDRPKRW